MIDPHAHLRDWNESHKETLAHGLRCAYRAGIDAVFEMPNTSPPLISRELVLKRLAEADACNEHGIFHGLYMGLTGEPGQVAHAVETWRELFPRVVGMKFFAGGGAGPLNLTGEDSQRLVFKNLAGAGFDGVLAVHCEKEALFKPGLWNPYEPFSHTVARPPRAEVDSAADITGIAGEYRFRGTLHICHVSVPETLYCIEKARERAPFPITCGVTPHHLLLYDEMMKGEKGVLLKVNPPLRPRPMQQEMLQLLKEERVNWIESDHAPHLYGEKMSLSREKTAPSGIPVFPYMPRFLEALKVMGMEEATIERLTGKNVEKTFRISIPGRQSAERRVEKGEYEFDPFISLQKD